MFTMNLQRYPGVLLLILAINANNEVTASAEETDDSNVLNNVEPLVELLKAMQVDLAKKNSPTLNEENQEVKDQLQLLRQKLEHEEQTITLYNSSAATAYKLYENTESSNKVLREANALHQVQNTQIEREIKLKALTIDKLKHKIAELKEQIKTDTSTIEKLKVTIQEKSELAENYDNETSWWSYREDQMILCQNQVKALSCVYYTDPGVHEIRLPNVKPFNVLCDNQTAGAGWTVIQQRINGKEDFYRDWKAYREGFGSFDGDFFLGLEKIHRLINDQRHELYLHIEVFNGSTYYVLYDNFTIASESDNYRLTSIDLVKSTAEYEMLSHHRNFTFSTFDRDNDDSVNFNCAKGLHGGWWFHNCSFCNYNGKFQEAEEQVTVKSMAWNYDNGGLYLKKIRMLIRPLLFRS